jgi:hypothetical protein
MDYVPEESAVNTESIEVRDLEALTRDNQAVF